MVIIVGGADLIANRSPIVVKLGDLVHYFGLRFLPEQIARF